MWDDLFKGLCPCLLAAHVAIALAEGLRGVPGWWAAARRAVLAVLWRDLWASGILIYKRAKYEVVEGIFKLRANLIRDCSHGWSIALLEMCLKCLVWQGAVPRLLALAFHPPCLWLTGHFVPVAKEPHHAEVAASSLQTVAAPLGLLTVCSNRDI